MLLLFTLVLAYGAWRGIRAASRTLRGLPGRNEDMIHF